jgi:hypothetical protein
MAMESTLVIGGDWEGRTGIGKFSYCKVTYISGKKYLKNNLEKGFFSSKLFLVSE